MTDRKIPKFEPEVIAAGVKKQRGDIEKVATTSIRALEVHDVQVSSRYRKASELDQMSAMVENIGADIRHLVESIFCDSKAGASYDVMLSPCTEEQARRIIDKIEEICIANGGGHNGISVSGGHHILDRNPCWEWDETED